MKGVSVIIPALNEEATIAEVIKVLKENLNDAGEEFEIIVVDDGSADQTSKIAKASQARIIKHPAPGGYGLSIRDGIFSAKYDKLVIIDSDGTYPAEKVSEFVNYLKDFDMVVGKRTGQAYRESLIKYPLRFLFNALCEFVSGCKIPDINSGFRAFRKDVVLKFKDNYCLGFSFTTTITLAFLLNGHFIKYIPIEYYERKTKSHVRLFWDGLRAAQIIVQAILYYNPIKLFLLLSLFCIIAIIPTLFIYWMTSSLLALVLIASFVIGACLIFGLGLLADLIRKKN